MSKIRIRWGSLCLLLALLVLPAGAAAARAQDLEGSDSLNWPKEIDAPNLKIILYQPQLETLSGNQLTARAAVSVEKAGSNNPVFGGVWLDCQLLTDRDRRTATPINVSVTDARFPNADPGDVEELRQIVTTEIPKWRLTLSLDHLQADLKLVDERKASVQGLKNDPPRIVYRSHAAVLLAMEGEPAWRALPGSPYRRIANSPFFLIQDPGPSTCYLHIPPFWWAAPSAMGPWAPTDTVPGEVQDLWNQEPKQDLPQGEAAQEAPARPEVISTTVPTELIWTQGPAQYVPIAGTDLLTVSNTESDVFIDTQTQLRYVLLSGRWFRKAQGKGPWAYVAPEDLPPDFGRIPPADARGHVLASVAGTPQSREALLDAEIPETVAVTPGPAPNLAVTYDGDPQWTGITDSQVFYAVNSPYSVFLVHRRYYCCQDGIWYDSDVALGPWSVCIRVPEDIYLIPPSCPHYYCTYCHVFSSTPGAVYVGYYPGYRGCYVGGRTVVFGTGWHYPCWTGHVWYPRPVTWGCGVRYSAPTGTWNFRLGAGGPCAWMGLNYHSDWHGHSVAAGVGGWWNGVGYRHADIDVHRNLQFAAHVDNHAIHNFYARQPERLAPIHEHLPQRVQVPAPERRPPNNVYVGPQGNTYRKDPKGGWETHTSQGWKKETAPLSPPAPERHETPKPPVQEPPKPAARPAPPRPSAPLQHDAPPIPPHHIQLEQQQQARQTGNQRAQSFQQKPPSPPPRPAPRQAPNNSRKK
jgi:hypothetical protein